MPTALITCHHLKRSFEDHRADLEALGVEARLPDVPGQQLDATRMTELIAGADAVIAGDDEIDESVLEAGAADRLRAVIKWGIGTDAIDLEAARRLGIAVFNTPAMFAQEVADLAIAHVLELARRPARMDASIRDGGWKAVRGRSLAGLTAGIVGLGSIGLATARRARAHGMSVLGSDIEPIDPDVLAEAGGVRQVEQDELLATADIVVLACALSAENRHMISTSEFDRMRPGAWIVNVARGALIDQAALVEALGSGRIEAAGLDVFETEPLPVDDPLRRFADRCFFTAHAGSSTAEAAERTNGLTCAILFDVLGLRPAEGFRPNRVA